jgi:hypothetical protein
MDGCLPLTLLFAIIIIADNLSSLHPERLVNQSGNLQQSQTSLYIQLTKSIESLEAVLRYPDQNSV